MDMTKYMFHFVFARDMLVKMHYSSSFDIVQLKKVTVQYTSKYMLAEPKNILLPCVALQIVTGQTPYVTRATQSVAAFKLKKNQVLGCAVTLRKDIMHRFITQCVHVVLPRNKEFSSLHVSITQPNVHFGVEQLLFFPSLEKHADIFESLEGCSIHVHTTAKTHFEKMLLCSGMKLPTQSVTHHANMV